jgi:hypothetical protein
MDIATKTANFESGATATQLEGQAENLLGTDGLRYSLASFADARLLAVVFISNGCPTVRVYEDRLTDIQLRYADQKVQLVAVNAYNPYLSPGDAYPEMVKRAQDRGFGFPYLKDEDGLLARSLGAVCTPHAFVFDQDRTLRYQGRVDDARDPARVTSSDLDKALRALLAGQALTDPVTEPFGCSIVW